MIQYWTPPDPASVEHDEQRALYRFIENVALESRILQVIYDVFCLDMTPLKSLNDEDTKDQNPYNQEPRTIPRFRCNGLGFKQFENLTLSNYHAFDQKSGLVHTKNKCLLFLTRGPFEWNYKLLAPLLVASHDTNSQISDPASSALKVLMRSINLDNEIIVNQLFDIILGHEDVLPCKSAVQAHAAHLLARTPLALEPGDRYLRLVKLSLDLSVDYRLSEAGISIIRTFNCIPSETAKSALDIVISFIRAQCLPALSNHSTAKPNQRLLTLTTQAYESMGSLLKSYPSIVHVKYLFDSLESSPDFLASTIQQSLNEAIPALRQENPQLLSAFAKDYLLPISLKSTSRFSCKLIAIRYAARLYPFSNATARLICLNAFRYPSQANLGEEASKGLHPFWQPQQFGSSNAQVTVYPEIQELMQLVLQYFPHNDESSLIHTYVAQFIVQALAHHALRELKIVFSVDSDWSHLVDTYCATNLELRHQMRSSLRKNADLVSKFLSYLHSHLNNIDQTLHTDIFIRCWYILVSHAPLSLMSPNSEFLNPDQYLSLARNTKDNVKKVAAQILGILFAHKNLFSDSAIFVHLEHLRRGLQTPGERAVTLTCYAHIISRMHFTSRVPSSALEAHLKILTDVISDSVLNNTDGSSTCPRETSIEALTELCIFSCQLDLKDELIDRLGTYAKKGSESSVMCLGSIALAQKERQIPIIEQILQASECKRVEFIFTSGEALAVATGGTDSQIVQQQLDIERPSTVLLSSCPVSDSSRLIWTLDQVMERSAAKSQPITRQYCCVWLYSLVQLCGGKSKIPEAHLLRTHDVLMSFLSEKDELVQEVASRGLSLAYELGTTKLRNQMIDSLVASMTSNTKNKFKKQALNETTELFAPNVMVNNEGKSITTYKDVLDLATDIGDPGLVHSFMSFANHSSIWAQRKGASVGFGALSTQADFKARIESDKPLRQRLIPKLFRYRFDPNDNVRKSMRDIWDKLVGANNTQVITESADAILEDTLKSLSNKEWRVRQASAQALLELTQINVDNILGVNLTEFWRLSFRVVDDIKASVREAGQELVKGLTSYLTRYLRRSPASDARDMTIADLVMFLIGNQGLQAGAEDVRKVSLQVLLELCQKFPEHLRHYVGEIIEILLDLLSEVEPQAMNYLALNAEKYGVTGDSLDATRMAALSRSPILESIEPLLDKVNTEDIDQLITKLCNAAKKAVGLPSKLGCSRVVMIALEKGFCSKLSNADRLLKTISQLILDRNDLVCQSYALCCGYISNYASEGALAAYFSKLRGMCVSTEMEEGPDNRQRRLAAIAIHALAKHARKNTILLEQRLAAPTFLAKFDNDEECRAQFEQAWCELDRGATGLAVQLSEILEICQDYLNSRRQAARRQVAAALSQLVKDLDATILHTSLSRMFLILEKLIKGKIWTGEPLNVETLRLLLDKTSISRSNELGLASEFTKILTDQLSRRNRVYQRDCLMVVSRWMRSKPSAEEQHLLDERFYQTCEQFILRKSTDLDSDTSSDDEVGKVSRSRDKDIQVAFEAAVEAAQSAESSDTGLAKIILYTKHIFVHTGEPLQVMACKGLKKVLTTFDENRQAYRIHMNELSDILVETLSHTQNEALRLAAADLSIYLIKHGGPSELTHAIKILSVKNPDAALSKLIEDANIQS